MMCYYCHLSSIKDKIDLHRCKVKGSTLWGGSETYACELCILEKELVRV